MLDKMFPSVPGTPLWRYGVMMVVGLGSLLSLLSLDPISQDTGYHSFADTRTFLGIPNFLDVLSNLPFLIVGAAGYRLGHRLAPGAVRRAWSVFSVGVALVSCGSAHYHWNPTNESLAWDRLPMTVAFMGLFAALLGEYMGSRVTSILLFPSVLFGLATVFYWTWVDDLRLYYWVQMVPLLTVPTVMLLFRSKYSHDWLLLVALGWYALAKVAEVSDRAIFRATDEVLSGHTLKHLLAAVGCYTVLRMLQIRRTIQKSPDGMIHDPQ